MSHLRSRVCSAISHLARYVATPSISGVCLFAVRLRIKGIFALKERLCYDCPGGLRGMVRRQIFACCALELEDAFFHRLLRSVLSV
jgi:hypothetical protein